jgi:hypothetical protein
VQEEAVEERHIERPDSQRGQEEELHHYPYPEVAKRQAVAPNEQGDGCNCEQRQVEVRQTDHCYWQEQEQELLFHDLFHDLCHAAEMEAMQPIAVPNELEDDCTQGQDYEMGAAEVVEVVAGPYASYEHDAVCDGVQGCQEPVDPVRSVEQQSGHVEGSSEGSVPLKKKKKSQTLLNQLEKYSRHT